LFYLFYLLKIILLIGSGDISVDEFVSFINNNVPQGTYGLKSIFRTIGKREKNIVNYLFDFI
jgi:hypothetical protein